MSRDEHAAGHGSLAVTLAPLPAPPRRALEWLRVHGFRFVQLSATQPGLTPRELDASARRDLKATLRRNDQRAGGIDAWIPAAHFTLPERADWAVAAMTAAIDLAEGLDRCPVSCTLPDAAADAGKDALAEIVRRAQRCGVVLADHALDPADRAGVGVGVDPAAHLAAGADPAAVVLRTGARLVSARLCDLLTTGTRGPVASEAESRLELDAYRASLVIAACPNPVVIDARQWSDPAAGVIQTAEAWNAG